jgi:NAD(P)-dependent dehydrogenase (short-subunit alcohol dehydrogenase family)
MPRPTEYHNRLAGKVAMVTGGGGSPAGDGIGSAIAELFAAEGAKLAILDSDRDRAEYVRDAIERAGGEAIITLADVTDDDACRAAVDATVDAFGRLDILVNSAAIVDLATDGLETMDLANWDRTIDVNLKGPMLMARNAVRPMVAQGSGSIINIGSIAAVRSTLTTFAYGPAKSGMLSLTRDIAVAYGRHGIRCNTLVVGSVHTPIFEASFPEGDPIVEVLRERRRRIGPLGIVGDAWDIAGPALFLAGDEARFVSGVELVVDAGQIAVSPSLVPRLLAD